MSADGARRVVIVGASSASGGGGAVDVVWRSGRVEDVVTTGSARRADDDIVVDAAGGAVIPGLHDHHVHLLAAAAALTSLRVGPPEVTTPDELARVLVAAAGATVDGWVRATAYHESVAGELDAIRLDELLGPARDVPVRVQHRSGQLWVLNTSAARVVDLDSVVGEGVERDGSGVPTGRVFGMDRVLRSRLPERPPDLAGLGRRMAACGVTGATDCTPTTDPTEVDVLARAVTSPTFPVRVTITGGVSLSPAASPELPRGPVKFLPPDHRVPDLDQLVEGFRAAHRSDRNVAIHCVSRTGLAVALAAWRAAGVRPGDRIEHGAVVPIEVDDELRALGLTIVTQPNFVHERGDQYLVEVDDDDRDVLWRCGTLVESGIGVAAGTDAPFGDLDPWRAIGAAMSRTTVSGNVLGSHEAIAPERALELFLGSPQRPTVARRIEPGALTDLCLLDRPLAEALRSPAAVEVRGTVGRAGVTSID